MFDFRLTCRFRKELEYAVSQWKCGEEENMLDLLNRVQSEAFADGCRYVREHVGEMLSSEREAESHER